MRACSALLCEEVVEWPNRWAEEGVRPPVKMLRTVLSKLIVGFGCCDCWNSGRIWLLFNGLFVLWFSTGGWLGMEGCWLLSWRCMLEIRFEIRAMIAFVSAWLGCGLCAGCWLVCAMTCCNKVEMIWAGWCWAWIGAPPPLPPLDVLTAEAAGCALSVSSLLKVGEQNL